MNEQKPILISERYRELNSQTHLSNKVYGSGAQKRAKHILPILQEGGFKSVLDYGCGKGMLKEGIRKYCEEKGIEIREYDPAIPDKAVLPDPADLVVCLDVLEHVEPEYIDNVLSHLYLLTNRVLFAMVVFQKSHDKLADGSQPHICIMTESQWLERFVRAGFIIDSAEITSSKKDMMICVRK